MYTFKSDGHESAVIIAVFIRVLSLHNVVHQSHGSPGGLILSSTLCGSNTMSPHTADKRRLNKSPPKKSLMEENSSKLKTVRM